MLNKDEVYQIVNCAIEVQRELGHGLTEKSYENALVVEFKERGILFQQQPRFEVMYKSVVVGEFIPDLIVFRTVVVETKVVDCISNHEIGQMLNYLKLARLPVGVILNFKRARMEWERLVLEEFAPPVAPINSIDLKKRSHRK